MTSLAQIKRDNLRAYRKWAYQVSPKFGQNVDKLLNKPAMSMGDYSYGGQGTVDASATNLVTGLNQAAADAQLSAQNYYQAMTNVQQMQRANQLGISVGQYGAPVLPGVGVNTPAVATPGTIVGIPLWLWLVVGGFLLFESQKR